MLAAKPLTKPDAWRPGPAFVLTHSRTAARTPRRYVCKRRPRHANDRQRRHTARYRRDENHVASW
jgi:hypothetical protein